MEAQLEHGIGSLFTVDNKGARCPHGEAKCSCKWQARWRENGRQRKKNFVNKTAGLKHLTDFYNRKQVQDGRTTKPKGKAPLLEVYANEWLTKKKKLAANTRRNYASIIKNHVIPHIGSIVVDKVTRRIIEDLIEGLESGSYCKDKNPVHPETINTAISYILKSIFDKAIEEGWINKNPATNHEINDPDEVRRYVPTPGEVHAIADKMPPKMRLAIYIMAGCGLRLAEVLGLTVDCIQGDLLFISRQWHSTKVGYIKLKHDRTGEGRWVPMDPVIKSELQQHLETYGITEGPIFPSPASKDKPQPYSRSNLDYLIKNAVMKAGLFEKTISAHNFRHFFATMCVARGVEIAEVSRMLGHFSIELTYKIYYKMPKDLTRITTAINGFLSAEIPDDVVLLGAHHLAKEDNAAEISDLVAKLKALSGMDVILQPYELAA